MPGRACSERSSGWPNTEDRASSKLPATRTAAAVATIQPRKVLLAGAHIFFQPPVQPVAESQRDFDHPLIAVQLNYIAHTIEHCSQRLQP